MEVTFVGHQELLPSLPNPVGVPLRAGAKKAGAPRWLPFSKQFSPHQVDSIGDFLRVVEGGAGSKAAIQVAFLKRFRPKADHDNQQLQTMAYNALLSAQHYGLVNTNLSLSSLGVSLRDAFDDQSRLALFARHILQHLNGIELVRVLGGMQKAGLKLRKEQIAAHFTGQGLWSNPDGTDINHVAGWLRAAGVFEGATSFTVDAKRFKELADVSLDEVSRIARVDAAGAAILEELALNPGHSATSGEIQRRLKVRPDLDINIPAFVATHLRPIERAGLITIDKVTGGRGGEGMRVTATHLFEKEVVQELLERVRESGLTVSDPELQIPMVELVARMKSTDRDVKGRGLELFALRLLLRLGLSEIRWRTRDYQAEEIDGSAVGFAPVHAKWQVQCKNTATLNVDDAAKEVGLALRNRSNTIMLVTTGQFSGPARDFVDDVIRHSPYTVLCLNGADVDRLGQAEESLAEILRREARRAHELRGTTSAVIG